MWVCGGVGMGVPHLVYKGRPPKYHCLVVCVCVCVYVCVCVFVCECVWVIALHKGQCVALTFMLLVMHLSTDHVSICRMRSHMCSAIMVCTHTETCEYDSIREVSSIDGTCGYPAEF